MSQIQWTPNFTLFPPEIQGIFRQLCIFHFCLRWSPSVKCHHQNAGIGDLQFRTPAAWRSLLLGCHSVHPPAYRHHHMQCTATNKPSCCFLSSLNLCRGCYKARLLPGWEARSSRCNAGLFATWGNSPHHFIFLAPDQELREDPVFEYLTRRKRIYYHNWF